MLTVSRSRTIEASIEELWEVVSDPYHLPRWWPRVSRVEAVEQDAFTEVLTGPSGKTVRADFELLGRDREREIGWRQLVEGTPFARVWRSAETEIALAPADQGTEVTIELRQELQGFRGGGALSLRLSGISRFGSPLVRRAAAATLEQALDGLARIAGRES